MWPVQTLTLLLCLTDEEQLFAQHIPSVDELPAIECKAPEVDPILKANDVSEEPTC